MHINKIYKQFKYIKEKLGYKFKVMGGLNNTKIVRVKKDDINFSMCPIVALYKARGFKGLASNYSYLIIGTEMELGHQNIVNIVKASDDKACKSSKIRKFLLSLCEN